MYSASEEEIGVVKEDLEYLIREWPEGDIKDDEIRRSSTVLRRLMVYRDLIKVWVSIVGKKDFLLDSHYIEIRDRSKLVEIDFATCCSAAQGQGMTVHTVIVRNSISDEKMPFTISEEKGILFKKFLDQIAVIIQGTAVTRNELIQFVAAKMGGAHYDKSRQKPREQAISAMTQYSIGNRPALIHTMLSCGQDLASSKSTHELLSALKGT